MRVGIVGAAGRMGGLLIEEARIAGYVVSGGLVRPDDAPPSDVTIVPDLAALAACSDVVVEFTVAEVAQAHAGIMAESQAAWVLGTTGLSPEDEAAVGRAAERIPVVFAANFSPGVTILLELARRMGAAFPAESYDAEILEMHHRQKIDAPSGTAVAIGRAVAAGRGVDLAAVTESGRDGHTGARATGAIGFAALRGGQVVGEHTLLFASGSEHIALTHRAFDRRVFASGAIRAAGWVQGRAPGLYSMADVMAADVMA